MLLTATVAMRRTYGRRSAALSSASGLLLKIGQQALDAALDQFLMRERDDGLQRIIEAVTHFFHAEFGEIDHILRGEA